jgi:hypothetical protein
LESKILFLDYELFVSNSFPVVRRGFLILYQAYDIVFFTDSLLRINTLKLLILKFFSFRGFFLSQNSFVDVQSSIQISFQKFRFLKLNARRELCQKVLGVVSHNQIRNYKRGLKLIVKSTNNLAYLISLLNDKVLGFRVNFSFCDFYIYYASFLDLYLNKLLWKWARRRHPRRTHSWIYSKYWTFFSGHYKFFSLDSKISKFLILRSHKMLTGEIFSRFPLTFDVFDLFNIRKMKVLLCRKFKTTYNGFYRTIFESQKGVCFFCGESLLAFPDLNNRVIFIRNLKVVNKLKHSFILVHRDCKKFLKNA